MSRIEVKRWKGNKIGKNGKPKWEGDQWYVLKGDAWGPLWKYAEKTGKNDDYSTRTTVESYEVGDGTLLMLEPHGKMGTRELYRISGGRRVGPLATKIVTRTGDPDLQQYLNMPKERKP